jgi:outer membrane receptor protein involved in Fe transport
VRSANLARIYQDAGMSDVAVREASRAVSYDYANYSAHLFLANSYDSLRDPNRINLRYETPAEAEYLIANLLAPVGGGILSQTVSEQEYSKLFERDRFGVASTTEYLSRGAWTQRGAQFGTYQNSSYMFEGLYRWDPGQRPNNDFEETELRLHLKQQLTAQDSLYFLGTYYDAEGGDRFQYYDPTLSSFEGGPNLLLRTRERQEPSVTIGYHREWRPGVHTLLFGGRIHDEYEIVDPQALILIRANLAGSFAALRAINIQQVAETTFEVYSAEAQQIWTSSAHSTIGGIRGQWGDFDIRNSHAHPADLGGLFPEPIPEQRLDPSFGRFTAYAYHHWQIIDPLLLVGGVAYDYIRYPENFRSGPMTGDQESIDRVLPKAGVIAQPMKDLFVRAAYTRSLAGAGLDQSIRIEPTQVAGFNETFRSLIPESIAGANAGATFETASLSVEGKPSRNTYASIAGGWRFSEVDRTIGAYMLDTDVNDFVFPSKLLQELDYTEHFLLCTVDQMIASEWTVGARYQLTAAELKRRFPEAAADTFFFAPLQRSQEDEALLHNANFYISYNHPSGLFAQVRSSWYRQDNQGSVNRQDEDFWHFDALAGYRFLGRGSITLGVLNLTDTDYRLDPLTVYNELPRERTFVARLQFRF